jgi:hypothetical protein
MPGDDHATAVVRRHGLPLTLTLTLTLNQSTCVRRHGLWWRLLVCSAVAWVNCDGHSPGVAWINNRRTCTMTTPPLLWAAIAWLSWSPNKASCSKETLPSRSAVVPRRMAA